MHICDPPSSLNSLSMTHSRPRSLHCDAWSPSLDREHSLETLAQLLGYILAWRSVPSFTADGSCKAHSLDPRWLLYLPLQYQGTAVSATYTTFRLPPSSFSPSDTKQSPVSGRSCALLFQPHHNHGGSFTSESPGYSSVHWPNSHFRTSSVCGCHLGDGIFQALTLNPRLAQRMGPPEVTIVVLT
jgi:hypothetical protein